MPLTAEEIQARRSRVGASDVAAIIGLPTFKGRNAYSLWLDKTGRLEDDPGNAAIAEGVRLEPIVLDYAETRYGELERNVVVHDPEGAPIASTCDALVVDDGRPVEAKTSGIVGPVHGHWGDAGTDDVPDGYLIQCQTQLLCTSADVCHLTALLGGRGFVEYEIEPVDSLMQTIRDVSTDFFERYVAADRDPREDWADRLRTTHGLDLQSDPCEPVYETVRRLRRVPGKMVALPNPDLLVQWEEKKAEAREAGKIAKQIEATIRAYIGDAEGATLPDGSWIVRSIEGAQPKYDRKAMEADGVFDTYATPGTREVLRVRKAK